MESRFGADRVAQHFAALLPDGSYTDAADPAAISAAIADAQAELDSILGMEYQTPFQAPFDPMLIMMGTSIAMFAGNRRRPEYATPNRDQMLPYEREYKIAMRTCEEIKQNKRRLAHRMIVPGNVGGQTTNTLPQSFADIGPGVFVAGPNRRGGFNSGMF